MVEITRVSFCSSKWSPVTKLNEKGSMKTKVWWNLSTWIQLDNFGHLENRTRREVNSCVAFWQFFAKRLFFADSFSYDHRINKLSPKTPPEISIRNFWFNKNFRKWNFYREFDREWARNGHFWSYGWFFRVWRSQLSFRFHGTVYQIGTTNSQCKVSWRKIANRRRNC